MKHVFYLFFFACNVVYSQNNQIDAFQYNYVANKNRLVSVYDDILTASWPTDIDNQVSNNYYYNTIGQLSKDEAEGIDTIYWNLQGLVRQVVKVDGDTISFVYNSLSQRIKKEVVSEDSIHQIIYTYYSNGNVAAIYEKVYTKGNIMQATLKEVGIYGLDRVGMYQEESFIQSYKNTTEVYTREIKNKFYELKNHLGDIKTIVSDANQVTYTLTGKLKTINCKPETVNSFYAYGMQQPGRSYSNTTYRYGIQGKENEVELKGEGNFYNFGARMLDSRLGRWLSIDPKSDKQPSMNPYNSMGNNPTTMIDSEGMEQYLS